MGDPTKAANDLASPDAQSDWQQAMSPYSRIVIPFAMPLLVGPDVIANVILYASKAEAAGQDRRLIGLMPVCAGVSLMNSLIFMSGRWLKQVLGDVGLSIATRILGLLVASMGIQFITTGLSNIVIHSIAPQILGSQRADLTCSERRARS